MMYVHIRGIVLRIVLTLVATVPVSGGIAAQPTPPRTLTIYATANEENEADWVNEIRAIGPRDSNGSDDLFARTNVSDTTESLFMNAFGDLGLADNEFIDRIWVNVAARYNQNTSGNRVRVRVGFDGQATTNFDSPAWSQGDGDTSFRWVFGGNGVEVSQIDPPWTQADIDALRLGVRRLNDGVLRIDSFRIIVLTVFDTDRDGVLDPFDNCPNNPNLTEPTPECGCDVFGNMDDDNDGTPNCIDDCPNNPDLTEPTPECGCDVFGNMDDDNDGTPNCIDVCPEGDDDTDIDMDGIPDACDDCIGTPKNPDDCDDCNGNGNNDADDITNGTSNDCDGNGIPDECEVAPALLPLRYTWAGPDLGLWSSGANWCSADTANNGFAPLAGDLATFGFDGTLAVNVPTGTTVGALHIEDTALTLNLTDSIELLSIPALGADTLLIGTGPNNTSLSVPGGELLLDLSGNVRIATAPTSDATLDLSGPTTLLEVGGDVAVGDGGVGTMHVHDGAVAFMTNLTIGGNNGFGLVTVGSGSGTPSELNSVRDIAIKRGELRVDSGGIVSVLFGSSDVFVDADGILSGAGGTIDAGVQSVGLTSPGGDGISGLIIDGSFQQGAVTGFKSGSLLVQIGESEGNPAADTLTVTGPATLGGGLVISNSGLTSTDGSGLPSIVTASSIISEFDVVFSPVINITDNGSTLSGTLVPVVSLGRGPGVSIDLQAVTLDELLFGTSEFAPDGQVNDAVLGDVTGDGVDDLVIAVPSLGGSPSGAVALLRGDTTNGFEFVAVDLYINPLEVDGPTAVEIGDFDGDGTREIIFASGNATGVSNDLHVIRFDGSGLADDPGFGPLDIVPGSVVVDLAASEGFFANPRTGVASLERTGSGGSGLRIAQYGTDWEICDLPVDDDDPDSVDRIDTDGSGGLYTPGVAVTTRETGQVTVFIADALDATPDDWTPISFATGAGPRDVRARDLDGDGVDDLVVINQTAGTISVLRTRGGGDISPPVEIPASADPVSLTLADLDDDGDRDVIIVASNGTDRVVRQLRNTTSAAGTITLAAAEDIPNQADGTPRLVRSSDLDGSNGSGGVEDDLVILVDPTAGRGPSPAMHGVRLSEPAQDCPGDVNNDGVTDGSDFFAWVNAFGNQTPGCDVNNDTVCDGGDFFAWVNAFGNGC